MLSTVAAAVTVAVTISPPSGAGAGHMPQDSPAAAAPAARTAGEEIRRRVEVGQKVTITDDAGRQLEGRIGELGPDRLSIVSRAGAAEVEYERVVRIDRPHDGLGNGARWGFGAGAALGLALVLQEAAADCDPGAFFSCGDPHPAAYAIVPAFLGGVGAAIGVGIDALVRREPNIYRRGDGASVRVVPRFGRRAAGAALSVTW